MIPYIVFIFLCILFSLIFDKQDEKSKSEPYAFWLMCLYLICLSGLSYGLGGDKFSYMKDFEELPLDISLFEYVKEQFITQTYMPSWSIVNYLCKDWFNSFYVVQFVESIVVNVSICYLARKYTKNHFLFLAIFFLSEIYFQFNTEVMREGFAIAIGLIAIDQYNQKQHLVAYLLAVLLALSFHLSAAILFLYPIVTKINITLSKKNFAIYCAAIIVAWTISDLIMFYVIPHLSTLSESFKYKLLSYIGIGTTIKGFANLFCRYLILPFIVGYYYIHRQADSSLRKTAEYLLLYELILGGIICIVGFGFVRFFNYVRIINLCWLTTLIFTFFQERKHVFARAFVILAYVGFAFLHWNTYFPESRAHFYDLFVPYTSILNEDNRVWEREYIYQEAITPLEETKAQRDIQ